MMDFPFVNIGIALTWTAHFIHDIEQFRLSTRVMLILEYARASRAILLLQSVEESAARDSLGHLNDVCSVLAYELRRTREQDEQIRQGG
jgi:hypothetical protein